MTTQSSAGGALCDATLNQIGGFGSFAGFSSTVILNSNPKMPFNSPWGVADKTLLQSNRVGAILDFSAFDAFQGMTTRVRQAPSDVPPGGFETEGGDTWHNRTGQTVKSGQWFVQVRGAVFGDTMVSEVSENLEDRVAREMPDSTGGWTWETQNTVDPTEFVTHPASNGVFSASLVSNRAFAFCPEVGSDQFVEWEFIQNPTSRPYMGIALRSDGVTAYYSLYARENDAGTDIEVRFPGGGLTLGSGPQVHYDVPYRMEVVGHNPVTIRCGRVGEDDWVTITDTTGYQLAFGRTGLWRTAYTVADQGVYKRLRFGSA